MIAKSGPEILLYDGCGLEHLYQFTATYRSCANSVSDTRYAWTWRLAYRNHHEMNCVCIYMCTLRVHQLSGADMYRLSHACSLEIDSVLFWHIRKLE